jgi:EAL domain-containing protein (putative c-di-GMP-specific phosphodiesterase class I)
MPAGPIVNVGGSLRRAEQVQEGGRMTANRPAERDAFLEALAHTTGTRLALFVPTHGSSRVLWRAASRDNAEVARLEKLGRAHLSSRRRAAAPLRAASDAVVSPGAPDAVIATIRATVADDEPAGAVVAAKAAGNEWTQPELALVGLAAEYYQPTLGGARPRPRPGPARPAEAGLEAAMHSAAANGELHLDYQPEVDLRSNQVVAVEALVRWRHPLFGEMGPDSFITLAERTGLIKIIGAWVVAESLRDLAAWRSRLPGLDVTVRVNVSPVQIATDDVVSLIAAALEETGVPAQQVCIEITENDVPGEDLGRLATALHGLRNLGVTSAIDDLGNGYSSLSRLRILPVELIKIDRSLVTGLDRDARAQAIVRALLRLADDLGVEAVAEGVETAGEAGALVRLGCRHAQGHYLGRPMSSDAVLDLLRDRARFNAGVGPT